MLKPAVCSSSAGHPDTLPGALWHVACGVDAPCSRSSSHAGILCKTHLYRHTGVVNAALPLTANVAGGECKSGWPRALQLLRAPPTLLAKHRSPAQAASQHPPAALVLTALT